VTSDQMTKELLVVISDEGYVRNYMATNAFSEIESSFSCSYLVSDKIKNIDAFLSKARVDRYVTNRNMEKRHYNFFNILMWKYREKSSSFYFRAMRERRLHFVFSENEGSVKKTLKSIWRIFRYTQKSIIDAFRTNELIFPSYSKWYIKKLKINADLEEKVGLLKPDLIIFPSSAYDPDGIDLVRIGKKDGTPVLFLIDNWDNLSSKSILWERPDYVAVWGEQSAGHAINIQDFKKEQVTCIGTPRFDAYFQDRDRDLKSSFDFKYILFVGTALEFDEAGVLVRLNDILARNQNTFKSIKIVYRPHPWRQGSDSIVGRGLENIVIDPQMIGAYTAVESNRFQPDLSYYPALLKNAEFVIGGLTSMLIEALIFRRKFLALAYDDGKNFTSQHNVLKYYTHFQGLRNVDSISFCEDIESLEKVFLDAWSTRSKIDDVLNERQRQYFYFSNDQKYSERLKDLCTNILQ
jgi:hypothetical protein